MQTVTRSTFTYRKPSFTSEDIVTVLFWSTLGEAMTQFVSTTRHAVEEALLIKKPAEFLHVSMNKLLHLKTVKPLASCKLDNYTTAT